MQVRQVGSELDWKLSEMLDSEGLSWWCEGQLEIRNKGWAAEASTETNKVTSLSMTWLMEQGPLSASPQVMQNFEEWLMDEMVLLFS